jgi:thymidylate synthase
MQQYLDLVREVIEAGTEKVDRTGVGTRSLTGKTLRFKMSDGFPLLTTKKVPFRLPLEEMFFFIRGGDNNSLLREKNVTIWDEWADPDTGDLGRLYGVQWRDWTSMVEMPYAQFMKTYPTDVLKKALANVGRKSLMWPVSDWEMICIHEVYSAGVRFLRVVDQIRRAEWQLKNDPYSRRIIVTAWNPGELDLMALPPCHYTHQLVVSGERLSLVLSIRSNDLGLGCPFNIAQYAALLHMYATVSGLVPDELIINIGDAHVYLNHIEALEEQLRREPRSLPTLWIDRNVTRLEDFNLNHFRLDGYNPHPHIKMDVAV